MSNVKLTRRGLRHSDFHDQRTVDVVLDGHRVWSCTVPSTSGLIGWPTALRRRLVGKARAELRDSLSGDKLWTGTLRWSGRGQPDLRDSRGRHLRINKWGLLSPSFETRKDIRPLVAALAGRVLAVIQDQGLQAFIVGGTLLGAVRDGEILPHDDDADIAYLSEHTDPADLVIQNYQLHQVLVSNGFRVLRHSWSHLQVLSDDTGEYYVDIFTAFYKDGHFHEPIHVREPGMEDAILPLGALTLHGVDLATPRNPEAWLEACYGPNWRTPDPSFAFETPEDTQRRFHAWFGAFHTGLDEWAARYRDGRGGHESDNIRSYVIGEAHLVVDLGAGDGEDIGAYREAGMVAIGAEAAVGAPSLSLGATYVNLIDYLPAFAFLRDSLATTTDTQRTIVAANHLLACHGTPGRTTILQLFAFALRRGARVITADYEQLGRYSPEVPRTWHLEWTTRIDEAADAGLQCILLGRSRVIDEDGIARTEAIVEYRLAQKENP